MPNAISNNPIIRVPLAKLAVTESGMGIVEDKVIKNHFASEYIYNAYKDEKTCGILCEDKTFGTITIAEPIGLICGIVPTTNPTSTAIFKALISLKTRNGIIFSPHPRAKDATNKAADIVLNMLKSLTAKKKSRQLLRLKLRKRPKSNCCLKVLPAFSDRVSKK